MKDQLLQNVSQTELFVVWVTLETLLTMRDLRCQRLTRGPPTVANPRSLLGASHCCLSYG